MNPPYENLRDFLKSPLWNDYIKPTLMLKRDGCVRTLCAPRDSPQMDDFLKGQISGIDFMLNHFQSVLSERDVNHQQEETDPQS